jgi:hypothetical protein
MSLGLWRLAQPIIFDENGDLQDGQHRLLAPYFTGSPVEVMVLVVPNQDDLFSVIDSGRSRTATDTLQTAGLAVSAACAAAVKLVYKYEIRKLGVFKQPSKLPKMSNLEVLRYARLHPEIVDADREMVDNYPAAMTIIDNDGVSVAFYYLLNQRFDDGVSHDFLTALTTEDGLDERKPTDPIVALHQRLLNEAEKIEAPRKLALLIKAFALDVAGQKVAGKVGGLGMEISDTEPFPLVEDVKVDEPV